MSGGTASYPRGWDYSSYPGAGFLASVTLPAIPEVSHVLTALNAQMVNTNAGNAAAITVIMYWTGAPANELEQYLNCAEYAAADGYGVDSWGWSGSIAAPVDTALTVSFGATQAGVFELLEIQGYDF